MYKKISPLLDTGVCAIIRIKTESVDIESLVDSLIKGGINTIEVSFDTANAISLIKGIRNYGNKK
ncbi:MAG: hypothetical protein ACP5QD_04665, partial [Candidatus Ratteibacteria bacterium]